MHKLIRNFATYDRILNNRRLAKDLDKALNYILRTNISPFIKKNKTNLIVLPVSIRSIPITVLNEITFSYIAEYDHGLKIITLCYNFFNAHSPTDLLDTLVHEYGHAYLFNKGIDKKTSKDFFDQHEFFSQMLSFLYSCKIFAAQRNYLYLWCKCKTKKQRKIVGIGNRFPEKYYKKYWYKYMVKLFKQFVKHYPPDKDFVDIVKRSFSIE